MSQDDWYIDNQDILDERREKLDAKRSKLESQRSNQSFWMRCPKCGAAMQEINLSGIIVEQCLGCKGLYFDHGELETLLAIEERKGFFRNMKTTFSN